MIGILVLFFLMAMPAEVRMVDAVPGPAGPNNQEAPLVIPVPKKEIERKRVEGRDPLAPNQPAAKKLPVVTIEIDARGMVTARSGEKKLAKFDANGKGKMKPLDLWLGKIANGGKATVDLKVTGDVRQQRVTDLLAVLVSYGISEITLTDPEKKD